VYFIEPDSWIENLRDENLALARHEPEESLMKKCVSAFALAALCFVGLSEARAQSIVSTAPSLGTSGCAGTTYAGSASTARSTAYLPYSYQAAWPFPARQYVGYGMSDFPFYGQPYGSPSDRWSWQSMSRSYYVPRGTFGAPVP
jgi:hypothetical protein